MSKKHLGSNFDDFLAEEAQLEAATAVAVKRVIAWQIEQEMKRQKLTKTALAEKMHTSGARQTRSRGTCRLKEQLSPLIQNILPRSYLIFQRLSILSRMNIYKGRDDMKKSIVTAIVAALIPLSAIADNAGSIGSSDSAIKYQPQGSGNAFAADTQAYVQVCLTTGYGFSCGPQAPLDGFVNVTSSSFNSKISSAGCTNLGSGVAYCPGGGSMAAYLGAQFAYMISTQWNGYINSVLLLGYR